ncbi:hypothetical protein AAMO2058_001331800 [Amorphochlora amoebiformis]
MLTIGETVMPARAAVVREREMNMVTPASPDMKTKQAMNICAGTTIDSPRYIGKKRARPRDIIRRAERRERRVHNFNTRLGSNARPMHSQPILLTLRHLRLHLESLVRSPESWGRSEEGSSGSTGESRVSRRGSPPDRSQSATTMINSNSDTTSALDSSQLGQRILKRKNGGALISSKPRMQTGLAGHNAAHKARERKTNLRVKDVHDIISHISKMSRLKTLILSRVDLSDTANVVMLSELSALQNLELDSTGITDKGIEILANSPVSRNLQYLMVGSHEPVALTSLTALDIANHSEITSAGITAVVVGMPYLRFLNLDGTNADDEAARAIAMYGKNLEWLSVQSCRITNAGIRMLSGLQKLREMGVTYCEKLTPECIPDLLATPALETVELLDATGTSGISREAVERHARTIHRANQPDVNMFCWTIGSIGENFLPPAFASPVFSAVTDRWVLRDSSRSNSNSPPYEEAKRIPSKSAIQRPHSGYSSSGDTDRILATRDMRRVSVITERQNRMVVASGRRGDSWDRKQQNL